jgi:hypothetical protein
MDSAFENTPPPSGQFQKKVYTRLSSSDISPLFSKESINSLKDPLEPKKIIATSVSHTLREEFKRTFLPLLIEVFELRQTIQNFKNPSNFPPFASKKPLSSPKEILKRLEALQNEIEETKRWCEGVVLQISKGVDEAREALKDPETPKPLESQTEKPKHFISRLLKLFKNPPK